ncbi:MAG: hypothetical protein QOG15_1105 [Solirubrobacteraceae bacterium]|jgi:hypothetical protein|nr:hypothetical protein [Solirubrobacteraceae bacterium]
MVTTRIGRDAGAAWLALAASAVVVASWMVWQPHTADLAAQVYREGLFERVGWTLWDNNWFGGHHVPGYSLLTPWLMAQAGIAVTGAVAALTTTVAFAAIARALGSQRWRWATVWVAWAATGDLLIGRVTYAVGLALAVVAVLAIVRRWPTFAACVLGALCAAASPVAGLFLATAVLIWWTFEHRHAMLAVAASSVTVTIGCALLFGDGGAQPYSLSAAALAIAITVALWAGVAPDARLARRALLVYAVIVAASWLLPTPMGSNVARLGVAFALPVALLARHRISRAYIPVVGVAAAAWLVFAPVTEVAKSLDAPETRAGYYAPLLAQLKQRGATAGRVEVVPSATRWETVYVGERYLLARGWETQLDRAENSLFYAAHLDGARYVRWLRSNAVRFVALSRAPKERWGRAEEQLLRHGVGGVRLAWASRNWRIYAVYAPQPLVSGARVTHMGADRIVLRIASPATVVLRVRWSRYWHGDPGVSIARRRDGFMNVTAPRAGRVVLHVSLLSARTVAG